MGLFREAEGRSKGWEADKQELRSWEEPAEEGRSSNTVMSQGAALKRVLGKEVLETTPSCANENRRHPEQLTVAAEGQNAGMESKCPAGSQE